MSHPLTFLPNGPSDRLPPMAHFLFALTQDLAHEALEGLRQRSVRYIPLVLVELPRNKNPARQHDRLLQFVEDGGLADSRVTRYDHTFRLPASRDPLEAPKNAF